MKNLTSPRVWLPMLLCVAAVAAGLSLYPDFFLTVRCSCVEPFKSAPLAKGQLLGCSNITQTISWERSSNVTLAKGDVEGWDVLTPTDPNLPAVLAVEVSRDRDQAVWFPRMSGEECAITVLTEGNRPVDRLRGTAQWSPIGARRWLNLRCLRYGDVDHDDVVELIRIQMYGRWAQVWSKQGKVFF
ncbi:hypothetical protein [Fundidesulfovibrio agrisoli]|uniref:hypothetical protein n=1 Tax=Fundidesulfovibrio agrisoli TaxID=2922717 RepID=UPI001FAC7A2D|nr:hypothetical protein [Fundidesulfovibrio agrisoli]